MKDYLGDSVYAEYDGAVITLTTQNEATPSNTIVLESEVLSALQQFVARATGVEAPAAPVTSDDPYGLLAYNAFLVANPEHAGYAVSVVFCGDADEFASKVRTLGKCEKSSGFGFLNADRWFGRVRHQVTISKDVTCVMKQTGVKQVTKLVPAVEVEMVEVTVEEPIMEWVCPESFLALGNGKGGR